MIARTNGGSWLLGELRRLEWRRLLLAVALLAAWGRALVPLPAQAAVEMAGQGLCKVAGAERGAGDVQQDSEHGARSCPFCRLADLPEGVPPYAPVIVDARIGVAVDPLLPAASPSTLATTPRPPVRGPPATATTI